MKEIVVVGSGDKDFRGYLFDELKTANFRVLLIDEKLDIDIAKYIDAFVEVDFSEPVEEQFTKIINSLGSISNASALVYIEPLVEWAAALFERIGISYLPVQNVAYARDKLLMRERLKAFGLSTPFFRILNLSSNMDSSEFVFPLVVKPTKGYSSINVSLVKDMKELKSAARLIDSGSDSRVLVESFLDGKEYSLEGFVDQKGLPHCVGKTFKYKSAPPYFEELGQFVDPNAIDPTSEERTLFSSSVCALGIQNSAVHLEYILDGDIPTVVEIGARLGGDKIPYLHGIVSGRSILLELLEDKTQGYKRMSHLGAGIVFLVPSEQGIVKSNNIPIFDDSVVECRLFFEPGSFVACAPESYFTRLGYFIIRSKSKKRFAEQANDLIQKFEESLGVNLQRLDNQSEN